MRTILRYCLSFSLCITFFGVPAIASAKTNYIYPLDSWNVSTTHGEEIGESYYHMGVDVGFDLDAGDPVYASADGIVREAQERTSFGLVILIEHFPDGESANVSLYGHLRPSNPTVVVGQSVKAGDVIGYLGSPSENGGWGTHLHYGIHKTPYSSDWIYYGHVIDPETANEWYDPEVYIPNHLITDNWSPTIGWDLEAGQIVGSTAIITSEPRDIGSGLQSVKYRARQNSSDTWATLASTESVHGSYSVVVPLSEYADGDMQLRIVATDNFGNKTKITKRVVKDPDRYTSAAVVAAKGNASDAFITQWSYGATALNSFYPFSSSWNKSGDVAVGDVTGDGETNIIVGTGSSKKTSRVRIFGPEGTIVNTFKPFRKGAIRVVTGDVTGDGKDEIIVGSGKRQVATVKVYKRNGTELWSMQPFADNPRSGLDVTAGDIDNDGIDEVIVGTRKGTKTRVAVINEDGSNVLKRFKPYKARYKGGVNVTSADIDGDKKADIITGTESKKTGRIKIFSGRGKNKGISFFPFGEDFTGSVDVSTTQWDDNEGKMEIVASQASNGQAWVKIYRLDSVGESETLFNTRIYEQEFTGGARIAGWQ